MEILIHKTGPEEIQEFRRLFLQENNFQFIHDKCHYFGWADDYVFIVNGNPIGYGSVWGKDDRKQRDTIFEFYLLPPFRSFSNIIYEKLIATSKADFLECQTNNLLMAAMFYEHAVNICAEAILFEDLFKTTFDTSGIVFRKKDQNDNIRHDESDYVMEQDKQIVATGGFVTNYNFPYIDMYYEVREDHRNKGIGSLLVQELKKEAYSLNRIPAARCSINNLASKRTLLRAGMKICGHMLVGVIKR